MTAISKKPSVKANPMKFILSIIASIYLVVFAVMPSSAHEYEHGDLVISHPHIPATVKAAPVAAGYVVIINNGKEADRLIGISAGFSTKQQLHTMSMVEGVMRMRPLKNGVEIPAGGEVALKKGAHHIMFMKLSEQMQAGELRDVTFVFEKAGEVTIGMVVIDPADLKEDEEDHSSHNNHSGHSD